MRRDEGTCVRSSSEQAVPKDERSSCADNANQATSQAAFAEVAKTAVLEEELPGPHRRLQHSHSTSSEFLQQLHCACGSPQFEAQRRCGRNVAHWRFVWYAATNQRLEAKNRLAFHERGMKNCNNKKQPAKYDEAAGSQSAYTSPLIVCL
ncbi:unnamed protein product [Ceratitis capitata]|uniref:(Mediterranean fruit fly) hypothetical protein n=1 Tax=Ceratitis capitata TaxID=7213 RepID=A0A811V3X2_CERCA|nr:unnamed protein product [Ceratitis capitata]